MVPWTLNQKVDRPTEKDNHYGQFLAMFRVKQELLVKKSCPKYLYGCYTLGHAGATLSKCSVTASASSNLPRAVATRHKLLRVR